MPREKKRCVLAKRIGKIAFSVMVAVVLVVFLLQQVSVDEVIFQVKSVQVLSIIVMFLVYFLMNVIRALRFNYILKEKVSFFEMFKIVNFHLFLINLFPFRLGELSFFVFLKNRGVELKKSASTLILARIFDIIIYPLIFLIFLIFAKDLPVNIGQLTKYITIILTALIVVLLSIVFFSKTIIDFVLKRIIAKKIKKTARIYIFLNRIKDVFSYFEKIKSLRTNIVLFFLTFMIWMLRILMVYVVFINYATELAFPEFVLAQCVIFVLMALPVQGIGGFGTNEAAWTIGLMIFGISKDLAISTGFSIHIITLLPLLIISGILYLHQQFFGKKQK
ncbi:MAG: flippase-like domain-containing protein [Nanoarchaeota archaeon]|nr:flippase-like domain-containing protein [Nanoarchaeota archaeon]